MPTDARNANKPCKYAGNEELGRKLQKQFFRNKKCAWYSIGICGTSPSLYLRLRRKAQIKSKSRNKGPLLFVLRVLYLVVHDLY